MAAKSHLDVVLGAANVGDVSADPMARFDTPEQVNGFLNAFYERGYRQIDTARGYSPNAPKTSEPRLGAVEAGKKFIIDTKVLSREPGSHRKENVARNINESLTALKIDQINILYLHRPDRTTPFEETTEAIDKAYREGKFKLFGLSNYTAKEVEEIVLICERRGFVKPSVYQGQYNPVVRGNEKELFPVLRKYNIAFYAYSPAAGGLFAGNYKDVQHGGRFDKSHGLGSYYSSIYLKPDIQNAVETAVEIAGKYGINGHAAALRWTVHHGSIQKKYGDAVVVGASSPEQLSLNLDIIEQGPLPDDVVEAVGAIYSKVGESEIKYHN